MGRTLSFLLLLIVVSIGGYLYTKQMAAITPVGHSPKTTVDVTAVHNDLLAMANAERRYWATNARYASLDELRQNGDIHVPSRPNYGYSADATETGFTITAIYNGPDPAAPKMISIDETLALMTR